MDFKSLFLRRRRTGVERGSLTNASQSAPLPAWDTLYHRGVIDEELADGVLERLEVAFSNLQDNNNWSVALYLLYAPGDRNSFNSWNARLELKKLVAAVLQNTLSHDLGSSGAQQVMLRDWGFALALDKPEKPFRCRLRKSSPGSTAQDWFGVDADIFLCEEASDLTARGRFTTLTRALPIVGDNERVHGRIFCDGEVAIAPHLDLSQRGVRGRDWRLYVTEGATTFLIGPYPGCDLLASSLPSASWITFGPTTRSVVGGAGIKKQRNCLAGHDFTLRYVQNSAAEGNKAGQFSTLLRSRLKQSDFALQVDARVLPRGNGDGEAGYGSDWCELSSPTRRVPVSLRLTEKMAIAADDKGVVFLADESKGNRLELEDGQPIVVAGVQYRWQVDPTETFYGYLFFDDHGVEKKRKRSRRIPADESLKGVVARVGVVVTGRVPLLTEYRDDELLSRRGSILVDSNGRGSFTIAVASTSTLRALFTLEGQKWRCCNTRDEFESVKLEAPCEFIFGSSRFSLTLDGGAYSLQAHWSSLYQVIRAVDLR